MRNKYLGMLMFEEDGVTGGGEGDTKPEVSHSLESIEFHKKFSANREGVKLPPGTSGAELTEKKEGEHQEPPLAAKIEQKKPGSNVPKIIEDKRKVETERDEIKAKLEKFEKEDKPGLEAKIAELQAKVDAGGNTEVQQKALEQKLSEAESKLQEKEKTLVNENDTLRKQLSFYDLDQDPDFKRKFVQPLYDSYNEAIEAFQGDGDKLKLLNKALIANRAALQSQKPEDRMVQEKERNAILSQITDSLDEFSRGQFQTAMNSYIRATKTHAKALGEHEKTRSEILKERELAASKQRVDTFSQWTKSSDLVAPKYDPETVLEGDLADAAKELKLDPKDELTSATQTLKKVITGQASMEESLEILHKGRIYPALQAKVKAQDHLIKGLKATIQKLRGARPGGDTKDGQQPAGGNGKETREDFNKRFSAHRPGVKL